MSVGDELAALAAKIPDVQTMPAIFVRMENGLGIVNMGAVSVPVRMVGVSPPPSGTRVRVQRTDGQLIMLGPSVVRSAFGTVQAAGSPTATILVDGVAEFLTVRSGLTLTVGASVTIDWTTKTVTGVLPAAPDSTLVEEMPRAGAGGAPVELLIMATDTGRWDLVSSTWAGEAPWGTWIHTGAWFYGDAVAQALDGVTVTRCEAFLPIDPNTYDSDTGSYGVGTHPYASKVVPFVRPAVALLEEQGGWVALTPEMVTTLRSGGGIAGQYPGADFYWLSLTDDPLSGAIRIIGTRN